MRERERERERLAQHETCEVAVIRHTQHLCLLSQDGGTGKKEIEKNGKTSIVCVCVCVCVCFNILLMGVFVRICIFYLGGSDWLERVRFVCSMAVQNGVFH